MATVLIGYYASRHMTFFTKTQLLYMTF